MRVSIKTTIINTFTMSVLCAKEYENEICLIKFDDIFNKDMS